MSEKPKGPVNYLCPKCGNEDLSYDATAGWCPETQQMELVSTHDTIWCFVCEDEVSPVEIPWTGRPHIDNTAQAPA